MDDPHAQFRENIREWDQLGNDINEASEHLKVLKARRIELQKLNVSHMAAYQIDVCNLHNGRVHLRESKRAIPVGKKLLPQKMTEFFMREDSSSEGPASVKADRLYKFIYGNPEKKISFNLRRTHNRG